MATLTFTGRDRYTTLRGTTVVFAGVALVTSLLSDAYLRLLETAGSGVLAFLRPFMLAVGVQVTTVLGSIFYVSGAAHIPVQIEPWLFGALSVFFVASCLEIVVLTRSIFMHAQLRARFAKSVDNHRDPHSREKD